MACARLRGVRARTAVSGSADRRRRPDAEHAGRRRKRIEPGCRPPCAGNPGHVRTRWLRAWRRYGPGRRLVADPPPARPRRVTLRHRCSRRPRCPMRIRSSTSSNVRPKPRRAHALWLSAANNCCSSTAPCSTCSKPAPPLAAIFKPLSPAPAAHRPAGTRPARPASRPGRLRLRRQQARGKNHDAEREISDDRPHRAPQHGAANGTRSSVGLNPKSSPMASHTPRIVWLLMGSAT